MTQRQIARLACRLLALFALVMAVGAVQWAVSGFAFEPSELPGIAHARWFWVAQVLPVVLYAATAAILWLAADRLAAWMSADTDTATSLPGEAGLQSVAFSVVGLCILGWAVPGLASLAVHPVFELGEWRANVAAIALQVALGLALLLAARRLVALLSRPVSWPVVAACCLVPVATAAVLIGSRDTSRESHVIGPEHGEKERAQVLDKAPMRGGRFLGSTATSRVGFDRLSQGVLAEGDATVTGRVLVGGEPRAGLKLRLQLSATLTTLGESDTSGTYRIRVPPGRYTYDGYELDSASAHRVLAGTILEEEMEPTFVIASAGTESPGPNFRFVDPVVALRPMGTVGAENVVFEWEPYPGASRYKVSVSEVTPTPRGQHYDRLTDRDSPPCIEGTSATPHDLGIALVPGRTYHWKVDAYDAADAHLSGTPNDSEFRVE